MRSMSDLEFCVGYDVKWWIAKYIRRSFTEQTGEWTEYVGLSISNDAEAEFLTIDFHTQHY